ncbi:hypothetical protein AB0L68_31070 [Streptomyces sp. NPDC052164]|uniref:aromatic-ring hydroxylase C-terminal domain-containing protein n=1 Tax=Streptomyces sp. NPDC052164 TaxID=3155529 RepID=UPI003446F2EA
MLTADEDPRWQAQAEAVRQAGAPLTLRAVGTAGQQEADPGQWARLLGADHADTALLVRPDGHIAWRGRQTRRPFRPSCDVYSRTGDSRRNSSVD